VSTRDPNGPTLCKLCHVRVAEDNGSGICFHCRVASVGFSFRGGGTYGRRTFNDMTISERRADLLGDRVVGVDAEPASTYGW
jgi:hypothetical protein